MEPVQSSSVVLSDKPFIPPEQQSSSQIPTAGASGKKKATQPVEAPGAFPAIRPVEAPGATGEFQPTSQDVRPPAAVSASGRPEVEPPGPTAQLAFAANRYISLTGVPASQDEPVSNEDQLSDHPSPSLDEGGELSDIQSTGPNQEELLDVDQELSADQTYRETLRGVRSFMGWNQVPEFDSSSSAQGDNPFAGTKSQQPGKVSVKVPVDDWLCHKFEKLNISVQEGYPSWASETAGLAKDQFTKPPRTLKWYDMLLIRKTSPGGKFLLGLTSRLV